MNTEIDALSEEEMQALRPVTGAEIRSAVSCVREHDTIHAFRTERPLSYPCMDDFVSVPAGDWLICMSGGHTHVSDEGFKQAGYRVLTVDVLGAKILLRRDRRTAELKAENRELRKRCEAAGDALRKLPQDVFGTAESDEGTHWYIRDELIARLTGDHVKGGTENV